ncbi:twin-arginine translocation signal domain-containing protein [Shigella flexneri]
MSLSRRQFIQASGIALCAGAVPLRPAQPGTPATRSAAT